MEYTQEQIDKMLADAKAEATKGLFTEDDLTKRVTSEVDRRVETGIQKGLETQKSKWLEDYKAKANLTAEELAKQQVEALQQELSSKSREITLRGNRLDAKELLSGAGIPQDKFDKILEMAVSEDNDVTKQNITEFIDLFDKTKVELENKIKADLSHIKGPQTGNKDDVMTDEKFRKLPYAEKVKFKNDSPEQYKQFMK